MLSDVVAKLAKSFGYATSVLRVGDESLGDFRYHMTR